MSEMSSRWDEWYQCKTCRGLHSWHYAARLTCVYTTCGGVLEPAPGETGAALEAAMIIGGIAAKNQLVDALNAERGVTTTGGVALLKE